MRGWKEATLLLAATLGAGIGTGATARSLDISVSDADAGITDGADATLQCVPYARQVSGIALYGDAWTWWDQAEGQYARGNRPKVGAVMSFAPHGAMRLGHVAAVSRVIDRRTVLLRHANWSPIDGRRGQIEDNVRAVDVSPDNDWSAVRVWYGPSQGLGATHWPLAGFIYPKKARKNETLAPRATLAIAEASAKAVRAKPRPASRSDHGDDPIAAIIKRELAI